jgi:hypothetical protein
MSGFNVVRFTVKKGMDDKFISENGKFNFDAAGFKRANMIKTGDHNYCFIAEWDSANDSINAEASMVAMLDCFRDTLEEQANGKGVTDFVVGDTVVEYSN